MAKILGGVLGCLKSVFSVIPLIGKFPWKNRLFVKKALGEGGITILASVAFVLIPSVVVMLLQSIPFDAAFRSAAKDGQLFLVSCGLVAPLFYMVAVNYRSQVRRTRYVTEFPDGLLLMIFGAGVWILGIVFIVIITLVNGKIIVEPRNFDGFYGISLAVYWCSAGVLVLSLGHKYALDEGVSNMAEELRADPGNRNSADDLTAALDGLLT